MRPLKVSAISFLNTAPLMWDFNHGATPEQYSDNDLPSELRSDFTIEYTVPSHCAEALQHGRADIGIIPAITYATIPRAGNLARRRHRRQIRGAFHPAGVP